MLDLLNAISLLAEEFNFLEKIERKYSVIDRLYRKLNFTQSQTLAR